MRPLTSTTTGYVFTRINGSMASQYGQIVARIPIMEFVEVSVEQSKSGRL